MKFASIFILMMFSSMLIFGCTEKSTAKLDGALGGGEAIEDENYGTLNEFDKKRMGDYDVTLYVNEWRIGDDKDSKTPVIRIYIKGNEPEKRVVHAWLVDSLGNVVTPHAIGDWTHSGANFLLKLNLKEKSVKHGMYKLWVRVDQAEDSWDVSVRGTSSTSSGASDTADSTEANTGSGLVVFGEKRMGDHDVTLYVNEWRSGDSPQPLLFVVVKNNKNERHNGHVVRAWLTDSMGNEVTPRASGAWRKGYNDYNCRCDLKSKSVPAGAYKLWVAVDEAKDSWDLTVRTASTSSGTSDSADSSDTIDPSTLVVLGEKRLGDHDVTIYVNEWRSGDAQPRLFVVINKNKYERHNGHVVRAWLTDSMGNEVTPRASGAWRKGYNDYNCRCDLKSRSVPAGTYKLWIAVDEAKDSWDVSVK